MKPGQVAHDLSRFDITPCPCYYGVTMKTLDTFGLTYSYPWGGFAPALAH